jgi:quercetin dioxygenase-like cupin family protein
MKRLTIDTLNSNDSFLLPEIYGEKRIAGGGLTVFKPGETAHTEPRHVHDVDEVFIFIEGSGVLPIDGADHPIKTGDVVIVEAGEDHHTRSSVDDPLVAAWYLLEK